MSAASLVATARPFTPFARFSPVRRPATASAPASKSWNDSSVAALHERRIFDRSAVTDRRYSMKIDIITLFPEICRAPLSESMMKRAQENGIVHLRIHDLRDWTTDKHHVVDDAPFGGGPGMVMKPEPIFAAVESLRNEKSTVVLMTPQGERFTQTT